MWEIITSDDGTAVSADASSTAVETGWHHLAFVADNPSHSWGFYYDGRYKETLTGVHTYADQGSFVEVGGLNGAVTFNGTIDEVRIYNRSITTEEINWSAGIMTQDLSGFGNHGLVIGNTSYDYYARFDGAFEFDGVDDIIKTTTSSITLNELTVETWIKTGNTNGSATYDRIISPASWNPGFILAIWGRDHADAGVS